MAAVAAMEICEGLPPVSLCFYLFSGHGLRIAADWHGLRIATEESSRIVRLDGLPDCGLVIGPQEFRSLQALEAGNLWE